MLCLSGSALAQTESARDKDLGILFSFNGLSDLGLGNYEDASGNYGLGVKIVKGQKAFRAMLAFGIGSTSDEPSSAGYVGAQASSSRFGLVMDGLSHLTSSRISPFIGVGLGFIMENEKQESEHLTSSDASIIKTEESALVARGILGVEIFLKKNISLSGEYNLQYQKTSTTTKASFGEPSIIYKSETKSSLLGLAASGKLTLSIYFANDSR
jgi:opacity protein-like surface antigen